MLYKNDEPYKLTAADHKKIKEWFPKLPIRLVYPKNRIKQNKKNRLPDQPTSISIPLVATVKTLTGTEQWRYAENKIHGEHGRVIYSPTNLLIRGSVPLTDMEKELIFFLKTACPYVEGGDNWNKKVPKGTFEDKAGAAEVEADKKELQAEINGLIHSSKFGLGEDKLRLVAKGYFIRGVEEMSFAQVKLAVEKEILSKKNGYEKFKEIVDSEQILTVKSNIQNAIDSNIIVFNKAKKSWFWVVQDGGKNEEIAKINPTVEPNEALYDYYLGNVNFAEQITTALERIKKSEE